MQRHFDDLVGLTIKDVLWAPRGNYIVLRLSDGSEVSVEADSVFDEEGNRVVYPGSRG